MYVYYFGRYTLFLKIFGCDQGFPDQMTGSYYSNIGSFIKHNGLSNFKFLVHRSKIGHFRSSKSSRRDRSNTPMQALTLMNDPMFIEIAEAYGKRTASVEGGFAEKATAAFRWLLTRPPTGDELALLAEFHRKHDNWSALARAILSLDEAITKN